MPAPRRFLLRFADGLVQEVYATSKRNAKDQSTHGARLVRVEDAEHATYLRGTPTNDAPKTVRHEQRRLALAARALRLSQQARKIARQVDELNLAARRYRQNEQQQSGDGSYNAGWMMLEHDGIAERLYVAASDLQSAAHHAGLRRAE